MNIFKRVGKAIIYHLTEKPECYVHVDVPSSLQEYRQLQYNNWCKGYGVYNGSYLPTDPHTLLKKGWKETTSPKNRTADKEFKRMSSGQDIRYEPKKYTIKKTTDEHYHWINPRLKGMSKTAHKKVEYNDRYGRVCAEGTRESHLAPLDKKYNYR